MSKEQKNKRDKYEHLHALSEIRARYPQIRAAEIERFAPVYYPIAMVEMLLEEQTFEDFETVQLTILRLVSMGISDNKVIAKTLGLSATYVHKVMHLLRGYGHITDTELTDLGRESLKTEKKIVTRETLQKFQVDALNGNLLKSRRVIAGNMLNERAETIMKIGHLNYLDGIDELMLSSQLSADRAEAFLNQRSGVLHTNVVAIKAARCSEIKYAKCYMLKLRGFTSPIVFAKRFDRSEVKDTKKRYPWMPLSVSDPQLGHYCGFEPETLVSTSIANTYALQMDRMMLTYCSDAKTNLQEEVHTALERFYPFRKEGLGLAVGNANSWSRAVVRAEALGEYRSELIPLLQGVHEDGVYLMTNQYLQGHIIRMGVEGEKMELLCKLVSELVGKHGRPAVTGAMKARFKEDSGTPLADAMIECLKNLDQ